MTDHIRADCTIPVREVERLREIANLAAEFCESMREYAREQVDLSARGPDLAKDQTCYADKLMDEINEFCWELEALRAALEGKMSEWEKNWNIFSAESEARRICEERGITNFDDFQKVAASIRHQGFMRSIEPYISQKCRILNTRMLSHILIGEDGQLGESVYKPLPPEAEQALSSIDELISAEAKRWGFAPPADRTTLEGK